MSAGRSRFEGVADPLRFGPMNRGHKFFDLFANWPFLCPGGSPKEPASRKARRQITFARLTFFHKFALGTIVTAGRVNGETRELNTPLPRIRIPAARTQPGTSHDDQGVRQMPYRNMLE